MFVPRNFHFIKRFSTSASTGSKSPRSDWKTQVRHIGLASQISSILLQRRNWITLVRNLRFKLPNSRLTSELFLLILRDARASPKTTLDFFDWAKTHLRFEPDLRSTCLVIQIASGSGLSERAETISRSLVETHRASLVVESMVRWFEGEDSLSNSLSLVLECYAKRGSCHESLEVFRRMRNIGFSPSLIAYNSLLDALVKANEFRLAWCLYGAMVRDRVLSDISTWNLIAQILCKYGKSRNMVRLLETGVRSSDIYNNLINCYSRNGEFNAVFSVLDEMRDKKHDPGFCAYGSILDDACRFGDAETVDRVLAILEEKKFLLLNDSIIQRLCDMGKTYASVMLFDKANDMKVKLRDSTYGSMLATLSKGGRTKEAVRVYWLTCRKGIVIDESCYNAFADGLCKNNLDEEYGLLRDVIRRGFLPSASKLSDLLVSLCQKDRWGQAEELFDIVMEMGFCPDSFSCSLLMEHYCLSGKIDKAVELHHEVKKMKGSLDVRTYNAALDGLMGQRKMVEEAVDVFEHMKRLNCVDSMSFTIMIRGLCSVKEMKKAMRVHDDMMKMGMKPDGATYKRLIFGFR